MKYIWNISILLMNICTLSFSQDLTKRISDFPDISGPYLGQNVPGKVPEIFAPGIISTELGWEAAISFSPNGKELFFTWRPSIEGSGNRLLQMQLKDGRWTKPAYTSFSKNTKSYEAFISPDGKRIFYNSDKEKPKGKNIIGDIWYSEKTDDGWSESKYLTETVNKGWTMFMSLSIENTLYFTGGYNRVFGIYKSEFIDGKYQEPEYLPNEINFLRGAHPFIAPDESYLIFDAQPDGMGKSQLFISFKDDNGNWTKAEAFNKTINATYTENIPNVSPDGKYFFFHRNNDIYWVDALIIQNMKKKFFENELEP